MTTLTVRKSLAWLNAGPHMPVLAVLGVGLIITLLVSSSVGAFSIPLGSLMSWDLSDQHLAVLSSIRMPRVLLAAIVGTGLAVSGAAMQGLFRNPLADPGLIGISSGAALMVGIVIVLGGNLGGFLGLYSLSLAAFAGGLCACFLIFRLARRSGTFSVTYLLLAGIAINALAGAGTGLLTYLSNDQQLRALTFWSMGSVGGAIWPSVIVAASLVLPSTIILIRNARNLNIALLGEEDARCLGVDSDRLKRTVILCTAVSVGGAVALSGLIGFLGLVVPHLIRLLIGSDHRILIPASAFLGAILLVFADTLARTIVAPAEMPVGILTSMIGGPFFLWLLIKQFSNRFSV
jgi:iron complex transport system permease protein